MRKIFAIILAAAIAVVGVLGLVSGCMTLAKGGAVSYALGIAITQIIVGVVTVICLIGTVIGFINVLDRNKANERALYSFGIFLIGSAVTYLCTWLSMKQGGAEESTAALIIWIVALVSGVLIFVSSLRGLPMGARKTFGIIGSVIAAIAFIILCFGLNPSINALTWCIIIGGVVVSVLGLILVITLKKSSD